MQNICVFILADDTVWDRDDIKANTVFTGSPGNNTIMDSAQDDVIHGLGGNDYIKIGAGSDTILYGKPRFHRATSSRCTPAKVRSSDLPPSINARHRRSRQELNAFPPI
jgi:hypothetical protein